MVRCCVFVVAALCCAWTACAQSVLHTASQSFDSASLSGIDDQGRLLFRIGEQPQSIALTKIVRWSSERTTTPQAAVALTDGSWLAGQIQWLSDRKVRVVSQWFDAVELNVDDLRAVLLNPIPSWPETQILQSRMLSVTGSEDVLWKRGSESAKGIVTIQIKKAVESIATDRVAIQFKLPSATAGTEVPLADLAGVTFSPVLRGALQSSSSANASALLTLKDSSRLLVKEVKRRVDGRVTCRLTNDLVLTSLDEVDQFVEAVSQITGTPNGITWLSDSEPARYRLLESDSRTSWPLGRNQDLFGKPLFDASGQRIDHALVIHSPAQAAYRWDAKQARLKGTIEIIGQPSGAAPANALGSVRCQVLVGRNNQLVSAWQSEILRAGQPAIELDADVANSQLIVLLVEEADLGTIGDHVLFRDIRIVPNELIGAR